MDIRPTHIELFAGSGGGLYAADLLGWRTVCAVERDEYCQRVLVQRQDDGIFEQFPIWDDVRTFDGKQWHGIVDIVSGGFPCQPFSVAGKQAAADDPRNMWPETLRIIREVRPRLAFLENVPGLISRSHGYFGTVLGGLAETGYDAEWLVLGADDCGAPHVRKRLWILAWRSDSDCVGLARKQEQNERKEDHDEPPQRHDSVRLHHPVPNTGSQPGTGESITLPGGSVQAISGRNGAPRQVADSESIRRQARGMPLGAAEELPMPSRDSWWEVEPDVGRVVDELANRCDRLRALGNGQVPIVAATAFRILSRTVLGGCYG